jgi:hypothetical protein
VQALRQVEPVQHEDDRAAAHDADQAAEQGLPRER